MLDILPFKDQFVLEFLLIKFKNGHILSSPSLFFYRNEATLGRQDKVLSLEVSKSHSCISVSTG